MGMAMDDAEIQRQRETIEVPKEILQSLRDIKNELAAIRAALDASPNVLSPARQPSDIERFFNPQPQIKKIE